MIKKKMMMIGMKRDIANEYRERDSLRSLSSFVAALCLIRITPAGIINASRKIFLVQKPAAASTDAATIAVSTSVIFSIFWKILTFIPGTNLQAQASRN